LRGEGRYAAVPILPPHKRFARTHELLRLPTSVYHNNTNNNNNNHNNDHDDDDDKQNLFPDFRDVDENQIPVISGKKLFTLQHALHLY
jgi:hypothetical protein